MYKHGSTLVLTLIGFIQILGSRNGTPLGMGAFTLNNISWKDLES